MKLTDQSKTALRRRTVLAAAIAVVGLAGAVNACADADLVDLKVVDRDTGQVLRTWRHHGRLFVAGQPGVRYAVRVTNNTDGRVLVVMSVDGVNVLTGETAGYDQRGYVLSPYNAYDVNGWRKSNTEIAAFSFAPLPRSYAARTGRPGDVGVIGVAAFTERAPLQVQPPPPVEPPYPTASPVRPHWRYDWNGAAAGARRSAPLEAPTKVPAPTATAAPALRGRAAGPNTAEDSSRLASGFIPAPPDEKLGTAHGAREWSVVSDTSFERATTYPQTIRQIEYDTFARLVASGVIPTSPHVRPRPFPVDPDSEGFVPDPPGGF